MINTIYKQKNYITLISLVLIIIGYAAGVWVNEVMKNSSLILATLLAGIPIIIKAFQSLRMKSISIELLVVIAVFGALLIQEYTESAIVTFLFLFGDFLEARTLAKTRSSIKEMVDMVPQEAVVIRNGQHVSVPIHEVVKGDQVVILSGGRIPVDGLILIGKASINEAAVTGESVPSMKKASDKVYSGTVVDNGYIEVIAEKVGDDTTFAKIIELVEVAQDTKSKTEKFLNSFSNYYTPTVTVLSIMVLALTRDLHIAITFLVIACPGALVIGAPVSNVAGIGNGAKNGVLVKGGEIMEKLSKVDTLIFDKTGTLTTGKQEVTDIKTFINFEENELLRLVAHAETISEHHLGQTIVKEAKRRDINITRKLEDGEIIKGSGIRAKFEEQVLVIGNLKLMGSENIFLPNEVTQYSLMLEKAGNTVVFVAIDGRIAGLISIKDQIRKDAPRAIAEMRLNGIKQIVMLTGDNKYTAELVASQLGIDEFHAELLPEEKVRYVEKYQKEGHVVLMAGDGINDAPAIATADIGLAMGEGGTDISMETADIVLMADKMMQLSHAYSLSKATVRNIKQNTYFAVVIVFILLIGVLINSVHLATGMFIHEASVLLVILNAMRLIRFNLNSTKLKTKFETVDA